MLVFCLFQKKPVGPTCHIVKIFRVDTMICQVNDYRVSKGLTPLVVSPSLIGLAVIKSNHPGNKLQGGALGVLIPGESRDGNANLPLWI